MTMSVLSPERLAELEYEACQAEKRDKLNARIQVWSLLIGLVGAFGLASVQAGAVAYIVGLYPFLAACVARYSGHSERVLEQVKAYLYHVEEEGGHRGYEHFNDAGKEKRFGVGDHVKALRDAIALTDLLAVTVVVMRLLTDHLLVLAPVAVLMELVAFGLTCRWLGERGARRQR